MFSTRTPADLTPNRLTERLNAARADGRTILDLTESNPTRAGFDYPRDLLEALGDARGLTYDPSPFGLIGARSAVARDYARRGFRVPAERIALTASTSEAYEFLFKLLADPGDEVLVPRPSYPLFDHLARLDQVVARPYDLDVTRAWRIDFDSIESGLTPRTRAILCVSPNNPTGSFVTTDELARLADLAAPLGLALIADEVFADYELTPGGRAGAGRILDREDVLAFSLGGLSKSVGLPQLKVAWIAATGPASLVAAALDRLELIADTYLSVSTPGQLALADMLERGTVVRQQIAGRVAGNYARLVDHHLSTPACRVLPSAGGWYVVLEVPSGQSEERLVLDLLENEGVLVHPGYFFDFPRESYLVVSLLVRHTQFAEGIERILRHVDCRVTAP
jgi:aspartate/methionine/tyrosine aminotransferase